ncbi:hypothetical protein ACOME3_006104 [Neoechinorhynchus agilis]
MAHHIESYEKLNRSLLEMIEKLKKEKEVIANQYEHEEEFLTNDLTRKLVRMNTEMQEMKKCLEDEQTRVVCKLTKKIFKLETDIERKHSQLKQLRHDKVELERTLEEEQERFVNRMYKRMRNLESEKEFLLAHCEPRIRDMLGRLGSGCRPSRDGSVRIDINLFDDDTNHERDEYNDDE